MKWMILLSGVAGAIVVVNQHVITGSNLEFSSHYWPETVFWCVFTLFDTGSFLANRFSRQSQKYMFGISVVIVVIFAYFSFSQIITAETVYGPSDIYEQSYAPIFAWLDTNTKKDDVVYAGDALNYEIPVYTADNVYYSPGAILFFMSDAEVQQRYIINHYFDDFTTDYIAGHERGIYGAYLIDKYSHILSEAEIRRLFGLAPIPDVLMPQSDITEVQNEVAVLHAEGFDKALQDVPCGLCGLGQNARSGLEHGPIWVSYQGVPSRQHGYI